MAGLAHFAVVLQDPAAIKDVLIGAQTFCGHIIERNGPIGGICGGHARTHRIVDPLEPEAGGEAHGRSITGDEQPVADQAGHHVEAALGNEMGGVLLHHATIDERCNRGMRLQAGDHRLRP